MHGSRTATSVVWKSKRRTIFCRPSLGSWDTQSKMASQPRARLLATTEGWNPYDLVNSQTYGALHRNRTSILEEVQMSGQYHCAASVRITVIANISIEFEAIR